MKIHRFITTIQEDEGKKRILEKETVFQIHSVLKLKPNEEIYTTDGKGIEKRVLIKAVTKSYIEIEILETNDLSLNTTILHIYIAILKKDNLETAIQKMTEIGITDITPMVTDRTIKKGYSRGRLEKIIKEAVEQSGQAYLPRLHDEISFAEAITEAKKENNIIIFFDEPGNHQEIIPNLKNTAVSFFIGPEGGFTEKEITLCKKENIHYISLGNTTLRAETAAIVGTFWIKEKQ